MFTFWLQNCLQNGQKVREIQIFSKSLVISKNHGNLDLSRWSRLVSTILIKVSTQLSLDCKSLDSKNLDQENKFVDLDMQDILNSFQKLVLTQRTFSISIGLDCRDHQGYIQYIYFNHSSCKNYNTVHCALLPNLPIWLLDTKLTIKTYSVLLYCIHSAIRSTYLSEASTSSRHWPRMS